jgi:hypothetical protein
MSKRGNASDYERANFTRTLKYAELYLFEYVIILEARARLGHSLDLIFEWERLHSGTGLRAAD